MQTALELSLCVTSKCIKNLIFASANKIISIGWENYVELLYLV